MRVQSLPLFLAALAPSLLPSQSPIYKVDAASVTEMTEARIHAAGDVDKDGKADFLISGLGTLDALSLVSGGTGTLRQRETGGRDRSVILVDLDGDGILEYVSSTSFYSSGTVIVRSKTSTGKVRFSLTPPSGSRTFGVQVTVVGDLDRDGTLDLAISASGDSVRIGEQVIMNVGKVFFYSGKDGKSLGECSPTKLTTKFGIVVAGVSDVNGDGIPDLAIGSSGSAYLYSGAKKTLIRELGSRDVYARFGTVLADVGDVNGDKVCDIAVGAPMGHQVDHKGWVSVYSGKTGHNLMTVVGGKSDSFGITISGGADLDGDNIPDFVVGAPQRPYYWRSSFTERGYMRAFSGKDGKEIFTVQGSKTGEGFAAQVEIVGDVNGDGTADIVTVRQPLVGAPYTTPYAQVISGRSLMLTTDINRIVASRGGRQTFSIDAGASHAGDLYLVVGSLYTKQGFTVNQVRIPLALDAWFVTSLSLANTAMFANTVGILDAKGQAQASLNLPKFQRHGWEGLDLQHSAVILRNGVVQAASAAAHLRVSN